MRADQSFLQEILPAEERAIESVVARYQRVAPAVTRFARSLAENEQLQVRLGSEPASGSEEIMIDPAVFSAAYARSAPVTPEEVALASALHETVHLISADFEEDRSIPAGWFREPPEDLPEHAVPLLDALRRAGGAAAEALFFVVEDARQEVRGLTPYPGARSVLEDLYDTAARQRVRQMAPLGQFTVSCFMITGSYGDRAELEKRVHPKVATALADATAFCEAAADADDPWEVAGIALQLLELARRHGLTYQLTEDDSARSDKARDEEEADTVATAADEVRLVSAVIRDAEGYDETKRAAEARAGELAEKGPAELASNASTDQLLRVSESPTVFLPSGQGGKLVVGSVPHRFSQFAQSGMAALAKAADDWNVAQHRISGELHPLFIANQRRGLRSGYDAGDLSPHAALFLGAGLYQRMYERRLHSTRRSYAVSLLVDASASMLTPRAVGLGSARNAPWGMAAAILGAWTLARMCNELQIDFEVALFNRTFAAEHDDSQWTYTRRRSRATAGLRRSQASAADRLTNTVNHYLVKGFDQPWRRSEQLLAGLFWMAAQPKEAGLEAQKYAKSSPPVGMFDRAANVDEFNVVHAAERMAQRRAQVRTMVVLADGMTRGSVESLAQSVATVERSGTTVLGIGIGDDTVESAYSRNRVVAKPDALAHAMVDGVRSSLRRSLALWGVDAWWGRSARSIQPPPRERREMAWLKQ